MDAARWLKVPCNVAIDAIYFPDDRAFVSSSTSCSLNDCRGLAHAIASLMSDVIRSVLLLRDQSHRSAPTLLIITLAQGKDN